MDGDGTAMIVVTRLNGSPLALNCELLERVEETPDTVLTLTDGTKYVISESMDQVIERVRDFQASVNVATRRLESEIDSEPNLRIVRGGEDARGQGNSRGGEDARDQSSTRGGEDARGQSSIRGGEVEGKEG